MNHVGEPQSALRIPFAEFIALLSMMTALIALSIDTVLPALDLIGEEFDTASIEDTQPRFRLSIGEPLFGVATAYPGDAWVSFLH